MKHEEYYAPLQKNKQLSPREIVARDRATKYGDGQIKCCIDNCQPPKARAMIAYNRMIDQRTQAAERSWRGK